MQCFALDSPGPPHIAVCAKLPWRTPYLSLRQSIGEDFAANGRPAAGAFSRRAPLSKRRADGAGRPAPIVIMRGLRGPAAGIGRAQMTVIDRCCEGFGPASRRQQKNPRGGCRRAQFRLSNFANLHYFCTGVKRFVRPRTRISQGAPRAAGIQAISGTYVGARERAGRAGRPAARNSWGGSPGAHPARPAAPPSAGHPPAHRDRASPGALTARAA
jgi:hypothetical protein